MSRPDPYSRSYWRFPDEYQTVYADDHAYALWCRLRDIADMAWPSAGTLPYGVRKAALKALVEARQLVNGEMVDAPLVFLEPGGRYRIRGMDKQRGQRSESARVGAEARWKRDANASGPAVRSQSERNANGMHIPSKESKERDAVALRPEEQREHLDRLRDQLGVIGALPSGRTAEPTTDSDVIEHCRSVIADEDAPQWKRDAARAQLEAMRVQP